MALILGIVLYGSRARGDHVASSDVDLLALTQGGRPATATWSGATVSRYPLEQVLRRARSGDLFTLHLVSEGKVIWEQSAVFPTIRRAFCYRSDYDREIRVASDVGWFLLHHHDRAVDGLRFNQRLVWCTRTILTAKAASQRRPIFSAAGLAAFAGSTAVASVIRAKGSPTIDPAVLDDFRNVLGRHGDPEPHPLISLEAERRRFDHDKNPAGVAALGSMMDRPCHGEPVRPERGSV